MTHTKLGHSAVASEIFAPVNHMFLARTAQPCIIINMQHTEARNHGVMNVGNGCCDNEKLWGAALSFFQNIPEGSFYWHRRGSARDVYFAAEFKEGGHYPEKVNIEPPN